MIENILIDNKNDLTSIKICDFGLSAQYEAGNYITAFTDACGTKIYGAPELLIKRKYSKVIQYINYLYGKLNSLCKRRSPGTEGRFTQPSLRKN